MPRKMLMRLDFASGSSRSGYETGEADHKRPESSWCPLHCTMHHARHAAIKLDATQIEFLRHTPLVANLLLAELSGVVENGLRIAYDHETTVRLSRRINLGLSAIALDAPSGLRCFVFFEVTFSAIFTVSSWQTSSMMSMVTLAIPDGCWRQFPERKFLPQCCSDQDRSIASPVYQNVKKQPNKKAREPAETKRGA